MEKTIQFKDYVAENYGTIKNLYAEIRAAMPFGITYETFCQWITKETRPNKNTRGAYMAARQWLEAKHDIAFVDGLMGWCVVKEKTPDEEAMDSLLLNIKYMGESVDRLMSDFLAFKQKYQQTQTQIR